MDIVEIIRENISAVAALLGLVTAALSLAVALISNLRRQRAERHYLNLLLKNVDSLRATRNEFMHDGVVDEEELRELVAALGRYANEIKATEKDFVLEALRQPSPRGQALYASKVFEKIGLPIRVDPKSYSSASSRLHSDA